MAIPTATMINGAIRLDIAYHWWAWAGLPALWAPPVATAVYLRTATGPASLVLFVSSALAVAFFWPEHGVFTFGPVAVLAAFVYGRAM